MIEAGNIDEEFIQEHTVGFEKLKEAVAPWTPKQVQEVTGVSVLN